MKIFSGATPIVWRQSTHRGSACFTLIFAAVIFAAGCGKKEDATPPTSTGSQQTAQDASPSNPPAPVINPRPVTVQVNANGEANLQQLNHALVLFRVRNRRLPTSFEDFAANSNLQIPAPPAGKKYALNAQGLIVFVDAATH